MIVDKGNFALIFIFFSILSSIKVNQEPWFSYKNSEILEQNKAIAKVINWFTELIQNNL
jgi:hypothetical protein